MATDSLFDPIRQKWVAKTPEEEVRQRVLHWLLGPGGFSRHEILVEKSLHQRLGFEHTQTRRFDIACVRLLSTHEIECLCLIECKALIENHQSLEATWRQIEGYNSFLASPAKALALASTKGCWYCQIEPKGLWKSGLPTKQSLIP